MKTKKLIFNVVLTLAMMVLKVNYSNAQSKGVDVIGKKVEASRGAVKHERPTTDVEAPKENTRGQDCCLRFDNYTGYFLDVWVDSIYRGRVAPYDDDDLCVAGGITTWYVETLGETYFWEGGGNCEDNYNIKLQ